MKVKMDTLKAQIDWHLRKYSEELGCKSELVVNNYAITKI